MCGDNHRIDGHINLRKGKHKVTFPNCGRKYQVQHSTRQSYAEENEVRGSEKARTEPRTSLVPKSGKKSQK
jgi:hypothetical protein